jgi:hypothetical protein
VTGVQTCALPIFYLPSKDELQQKLMEWIEARRTGDE